MRAVEAAARRARSGKLVRDVLAGARIEPRDRAAVRAAAGDRLHPDAVPFPFGHERRRDRARRNRRPRGVREHRRAERRRIAARRLVGAAFEPGEQLAIGRREPRPDQLDLLRVLAAERGDRGLGEPRRDADAQAAGDELEQRPAAGLVERVEPARELRRQLRLAERGERLDARRRECRRGLRACRLPTARGMAQAVRPHQRDGLGEIADIIVGQREQHRIGALGDQAADQAGLGVRKDQRAGRARRAPSRARDRASMRK